MNQIFQVKICGITNVNDAQLAAEFGADAIGLNFYARSLRSVTRADAIAILKQIRTDKSPGDYPLKTVGVFVNQGMARISEILSETGIDLAQIHGDETPDQFADCPFGFIRAIRCGGLELEQIKRQVDLWVDAGASGLLLDSATGGQYGGTGETLEWKIFKGLESPVPIILAGGLDAENVAQAIATARPDGVDVASGIEGFPGKKDVGQMKAFIERAKQAFSD